MFTITILKGEQPIYSQQVENLVLLDVIQAINSAPEAPKQKKPRKDKGTTRKPAPNIQPVPEEIGR